MAAYQSKIERALSTVGGSAVTVEPAVDAPWGLDEKLVKVTGILEPYGTDAHYLVFEISAADEVTDVSNASAAWGVHDMVALGPGKTNTERSVLYYVPLSPTLPREKLRIDWDGYNPEEAEVFWIDASEVTFAEQSETPDPVPSVYRMTKEVVGVPIVNNEFRVNVTFQTAVLGNTPLEKVRFRYHFDLPSATAHADVRAKDGTEFEDDGFWGPAAGFTIPPQYNSTSSFFVTLNEPGEYKATLELFNVDTDEVYYTVTDTYSVPEPTVVRTGLYDIEIECLETGLTYVDQGDVNYEFKHPDDYGFDYSGLGLDHTEYGYSINPGVNISFKVGDTLNVSKDTKFYLHKR